MTAAGCLQRRRGGDAMMSRGGAVGAALQARYAQSMRGCYSRPSVSVYKKNPSSCCQTTLSAMADSGVDTDKIARLAKMAEAARLGGKGSIRRKHAPVHKTSSAQDDKRLQQVLKRLSVNVVPGACCPCPPFVSAASLTASPLARHRRGQHFQG